MRILLTSARDGIALTGAEAHPSLAAGAAVVELDDGCTAIPPPRQEHHE